MNFVDDPDPWASDPVTVKDESGSATIEWPPSNSDPLGASSILNTATLSSRMNDISLTVDASDTQVGDFSSTNLFNNHRNGESVMEHSIWEDHPKQSNADVMIPSEPVLVGNVLSDPLNAPTSNKSTDDVFDDDLATWIEAVRTTYNPLSTDIVVVEEIPEREGILFKHTNYLVKHLIVLPDTDPSSDRSVIRRYSDFVWLQEVLLKKYPFRMIPELPPKKIGSHSADQAFLLKRRRGLSRFINLVMKHPVLNHDDLVLTFLTVPTDLSGWRKQASYDTTEEFTDKKISKSFMKMWRKELAEQWNEADSKIDLALETWAKITVLVERYSRRLKQISEDRTLFESIVNEFTQTAPSLYPINKDTIEDINAHTGIITKHLNNCNQLTSKEIEETHLNLSVKFKTFIDMIFSLKGLFERYKILAGNNIAQLQRRVELNIETMNNMKGKPDVRGAEYDKVKQAVQRDKRTIAEQMNRSWLIRECILEEFTIFQETQFVITHAFQEWAKLNMKYADLNSNEWERLFDSLETMPISRK